MNVLLIINAQNGVISSPVLAAISAVRQLSPSYDVWIAGPDEECVQKARFLPGAQQIHAVVDSKIAQTVAQDWTEMLHGFVDKYALLVFVNDSFAKDVLPRLAAIHDISPVTDVCEIVAADVFKRPIYAGNAMATVQTNQGKNIISVRAASFAKVSLAIEPSASLRMVKRQLVKTTARWLASIKPDSEKHDLQSSALVISGGRGLGSKQAFEELAVIAQDKKAALGASRAAVDAGFVTNDCQVGQTGKIIAPDVYVAIALSGATQHIAGMKDSKTIIAINKDPDAPVFQYADYGLVADWFTVSEQFVQSFRVKD